MISREFLTAGHAIFTVSNLAGEHYTYKVSAPDKQDPNRPIWFVAVLTGPNNQRDYTYLGLLNAKGEVVPTKATKAPDSVPFRVAKWATKLVWEGKTLPEGYKLHHEGRCGHCGRPLTTPESVESGIGPICAGRK